MAYKIVQSWLPSSKYPLKAPYSMKPKYITIHNTANDASAQAEASYMKSNNNATSFHVAIDDKQAIEIIPFNRNAWHAGDSNGEGNRASIGIEICFSKSGGTRYKDAEKNAIEYVAQALVQLGLDADDVRYHKEWSGKNCPHRIFAEGRGDEVKAAIAKRYKEIKSGKKEPSKPKPSAPKPADVPGKDKYLHRVIVDGKQVGAYGVAKSVGEAVEKAVAKGAKDIKVERV